jgi:hypothetical protein
VEGVGGQGIGGRSIHQALLPMFIGILLRAARYYPLACPHASNTAAPVSACLPGLAWRVQAR